MGQKKGYKQTKEHIEKRKRFGPDHHAWKGDNIVIRSGRTRALRGFPLKPCEKCGNPKSERHHRDDNQKNNHPSNIMFLCRKCHMKEDGRYEKFRELGKKCGKKLKLPDGIKPYYYDEKAGIAIFNNDCLEIMPELENKSIDMILADPPYGTTACKWDSVIPIEPMWRELKRLIKPNNAIVMTASQPFTTTLISSNMEMFKYCWVWDKKGTVGFLNAKKAPLRRHEDILIFVDGNAPYNPIMETRGKLRNKRSYNKKQGNGDMCYGAFNNISAFNNTYYPTSIIEISNAVQKGKVHSTQKPIALMEYLIKTYTNEGDVVLDFCIGSGTTLVAAKELGRKAIGIEVSEEDCETAAKRLQQEVLFGLKE